MEYSMTIHGIVNDLVVHISVISHLQSKLFHTLLSVLGRHNLNEE